MRQVFKNMFQLKVVVASAVLMGIYSLPDPESVSVGLFAFWGLTALGIFLVPYLVLGKKNFLSLNRLAMLFFAFIYFGKWGLADGAILEMNNFWINSAVMLINISVIKTTYDLIRFYKREYQLT